MAKWYAVQENRMDAWDNGSDNYDTAVEMLMEQGCGLIAVINEDSGVCEEEIKYDDVAYDLLNTVYEADTMEEAEAVAEKVAALANRLPSRFWEGEPVEGDDYPVEVLCPYGDEPLLFE